MKSLIILSIIIFSSQYVINENEISYLKQKAPFTVYNYEENPFKSYSETELKNLFQSNIPEKKTFLKKFPFFSKKMTFQNPMTFVKNGPHALKEYGRILVVEV